MVMDNKIPNQVSPLLHEYTNMLLSKLPDVVCGVYVYGSIALSAFDNEKSDIDFVTVLTRNLTNAELEVLKNIHRKLRAGSPLAKRMDGMYINQGDIGKANTALKPYPYCGNGTFRKSGHWDINHVTWWTLKHHGITVAGKKLDELPIPVRWQDVEDTMNYNLNSYWANKGKSSIFFLFDGWVEDAVLTLCRIHYTLKHQDIVPKGEAVEYALQTLPPEWNLLLNEALRIRKGSGEPSLYPSRRVRAAHVKKFISYMIDTYNSDHQLCS